MVNPDINFLKNELIISLQKNVDSNYYLLGTLNLNYALFSLCTLYFVPLV